MFKPISLLLQRSHVILVTGHYGCGKTSLSVSLALDSRLAGYDVTLCDLDIVNPYFRSADFEALMHRNGIATISPTFANTNLDIPVLGPGLSAVVRKREQVVIVDVGGDDAGAVALGRYAPELCVSGYNMLYVYNHYRYLTREAADAAALLEDICGASRLRATHIVNNSNLGEETGRACIAASAPACRELCRLSGLPLAFTAAPKAAAGEDEYPLRMLVHKPWERQWE